MGGAGRGSDLIADTEPLCGVVVPTPWFLWF